MIEIRLRTDHQPHRGSPDRMGWDSRATAVQRFERLPCDGEL